MWFEGTPSDVLSLELQRENALEILTLVCMVKIGHTHLFLQSQSYLWQLYIHTHWTSYPLIQSMDIGFLVYTSMWYVCTKMFF